MRLSRKVIKDIMMIHVSSGASPEKVEELQKHLKNLNLVVTGSSQSVLEDLDVVFWKEK